MFCYKDTFCKQHVDPARDVVFFTIEVMNDYFHATRTHFAGHKTEPQSVINKQFNTSLQKKIRNFTHIE